MKTLCSIATGLCLIGSAEAATQFSVNVNAAIPDGDLGGLASGLIVSGQVDPIGSLVVDLSISGPCNGDLYAYVTHGSGFSVLLNRPGRTATDSLGYGDEGLSIRLADAAGVDVHNYGGSGGGLLTGTFQPDGRRAPPSTALDTTPRTAMLSSFSGLDANGEWTLLVIDAEGGDVHQLVSWGLEITPVPEPGLPSLSGLAVLCLLGRNLAHREQRLPAGLMDVPGNKRNPWTRSGSQHKQ